MFCFSLNNSSKHVNLSGHGLVAYRNFFCGSSSGEFNHRNNATWTSIEPSVRVISFHFVIFSFFHWSSLPVLSHLIRGATEERVNDVLILWCRERFFWQFTCFEASAMSKMCRTNSDSVIVLCSLTLVEIGGGAKSQKPKTKTKKKTTEGVMGKLREIMPKSYDSIQFHCKPLIFLISLIVL